MMEDQTQFCHNEGKSDTPVTMRKDHITYSSITACKITFPLLWAGPNSYEHWEKVRHSEERSDTVLLRHARSHTVVLWHAKFTFSLLWAGPNGYEHWEKVRGSSVSAEDQAHF